MIKPRLSSVAASMAADAVCGLASGGLLRIYDGAQPASADDAPTGQLLAELTLGTFTKAVDGVAVCRSIADGPGLAAGRASWFRVLAAMGFPLWDGSAGPEGSGSNLSLKRAEIDPALILSVLSVSYGQSKR